MAALIPAGWSRTLARAGGAVAAFAWPQRCPACAAPADPARLLCAPCHARIPRGLPTLCARCLGLGRDPAACRAHPHHRVGAAWLYEERAALVVHALKYGERPDLAEALGDELARAVPPGVRPDVVTEVPLHPARRRERGYDQAARLADALADRIGAPRVPAVLARVRPTPPQARLDPAGRARNVAGAFRVRHPARIAGRTVLVVDDVLTTGATLAACLGPLADAGAIPIGVALAWAS